MDFYKLIKSLDALVFEILSWLYFYPRTLLRTLFRPYTLMLDTEQQMEEDDEPGFGDRVGPPLFLALTLGLIHVVEIIIDPSGSATEFSNARVAAFMEDDKNLLGFRIVLFGCLPLIAGVRELVQRDIRVSKGTLKAPFYAQCYAASGFAVLINIFWFASFEFNALGEETTGAFTLLGGILVAALWLGWVEARWFHRRLEATRTKAFWHSVVVLTQWLIVGMVLGLATS